MPPPFGVSTHAFGKLNEGRKLPPSFAGKEKEKKNPRIFVQLMKVFRGGLCFFEKTFPLLQGLLIAGKPAV